MCNFWWYFLQELMSASYDTLHVDSDQLITPTLDKRLQA